MQICSVVCQKIKKNNVQIFDIMGAASLPEIFTAGSTPGAQERGEKISNPVLVLAYITRELWVGKLHARNINKTNPCKD